jgi:NTE family protein
VQIGQNTYLSTEFYQPVEASGRWFVAPYASIGQQTRGVFAGDEKVADYLVKSAQVGVAGGAVLGTWGQFGIGPVWTHVKASIDTGSNVLPEGSENTSGIRARLFVDQTDHAWWPTSGMGGTASAYAALNSFGSAQSYQRLEGSFRAAHSWGEHTIQVGAAGGTDLGSDMPAYESFTLGGPLHLSGYRINQFAGRQFAYGRLMYYKRIFPLPDLLGSGVYAGASAEVGRISNRFDNLPSPGTLWSGSLFLGADTFVGPAFLGVGVAGSGNWSIYMLLGAP